MDWIKSLIGSPVSPVQTSKFGGLASEQEGDQWLLEAAKLEQDEKPEEARVIYSKLADKGNGDAQFKLGVMDMEEDPAHAFKNIKKAADQGHSLAINQLGKMYETGHGVDQSYEKAFECFEKVAEQIPAAKSSLGSFYYNGWYVPKNNALAFDCFSEVQDIDANAANLLGAMFAWGDSAEINYLRAFQLFLSAEQQGSAKASANLGLLYLNGCGVEKNILRSAQYFKEAVDKNEDSALVELIKLYEAHPDIVKQDPQAERYYIMAADRGNAEAQCKVGQLYDEADARAQSSEELWKGRAKQEGNDVRIGDSLALPYLEKAAEQGNIKALHILGEKYEKGIRVKKDASLAAEYYITAARRGDKTVIPQLLNMGSAHQQKQNYDVAFSCFYWAASLGDNNSLYVLQKITREETLRKVQYTVFDYLIADACMKGNTHARYILNYREQYTQDFLNLPVDQKLVEAQKFLGDFYNKESSGLFGTAQEYTYALSYYEDLKEQNPSVIPKLAKLYKEGWSRLTVDIEPDGPKAIAYYKLAVEKEVMTVKDACENIADMYENGIGIEKNIAEANKLRNLMGFVNEEGTAKSLEDNL